MSVDQYRGIITPEAVVLEFETAGIASRLLARLIDLLVQMVALWMIIFVAAFAAGAVGEVVGLIAFIVTLFLLLFGYSAILEWLWKGRTLGKMALGLRVVTIEGAPVGFVQCAIRSMMQLVDIYTNGGGVAIVSALLTPRSQRLGDLAAGTFVIRERRSATDGTSQAIDFRPPMGYEPYALSLDTSSMTQEQYGHVRSLLLRLNQLDPGYRWQLENQTADALAARLNHQRPAHVHPTSFLVCAAAAYQLRHDNSSFASVSNQFGAGGGAAPPGGPGPYGGGPPAPSMGVGPPLQHLPMPTGAPVAVPPPQP